MSDESMKTPAPSLYGEEGAPVPPDPAPRLGELLMGLFTEPSQLFERLRKRPVWGAAFALSLGVALVLTLTWALRVDVDAMLRPILEANPKIPAERIDGIIAMQGRMMVVFAPIQVFFIIGFSGLIVALLPWLMGKAFAEGEAPSFRQAFSAGQTVGLVMIPQALGTLIITLVKEVGGRTPDKLAPTSLGYYLVLEEQPKLQALLGAVDPFLVGYFALFFLACRRMLRLSAAGAGIATGVLALFLVGMRVLAAR